MASSTLTPSAESAVNALPSSSNPTPPVVRPQPVAAVVNSGASMAAVLKRDTEQQEKERQKQAALQQAAQQQVRNRLVRKP
jgi:hypothetical protein